MRLALAVRVIATLTLLLFPLPAASQKLQPTMVAWGTEHGLPSNIVLDVAQTSDRYLWLASYQGLVRFDGVEFRTFTEADIPGLTSASFWSAKAGIRGDLWAATENSGVALREHGGVWKTFTTREGLPSDRVTAMYIGRDGTVWLGSQGHVSKIANGEVSTLPPVLDGPDGRQPTVTALAVEPDGDLWIGTVADGLLRYRAGGYVRLTTADGLDDDRITSLYAESDGTVWVGSYGAGVTRIHGDTVTRLPTGSPEPPQRVNDLLRTSDGTLWLAADNGVFRFEDGRAGAVLLGGGGGVPQAESLFEDAEGSLWIGSRQGGLFRLREPSAQGVGTAEGLPHALVYAVAGDGANGEWIATQGGVAHRTPRGISVYTKATGALMDDISRDIMRDRSGQVWVATNGGLTLLGREGETSRTFTTRDGLVDDRVRTLAEGGDGTLWIGTLTGLAAMRAGQFTNYGQADGLTDTYILSVMEDSRGTLWVGTQTGGVFRSGPDGFVRGPALLEGQAVFRITESADGTLWAGSARGLARIRGDSVRLFTTLDGLPGNASFQALDDGHGQLWLTGPWGIGRVSIAQLDAVADGRLGAVTFKQLGRNDGLPAHDASSISRSWLGPDGVLRIPTPAGLGLLDPRLIHPNTVPPAAHVQQVLADGARIGGRALGDGASFEMGPGVRKLEFRFTSPSFVAPTLIRFRYRLEPFDEGWVDGGTQRVAHYTSLRPGKYTFRVQARNEDGVWSEQATSVDLRLLPHFWQTHWFGAFVALALGAVALAAHRMRVRAVAAHVREETLREASLRDELTGVYNRRGFLELADQQMRLAERERRGFTLVFVDMDGMKRINDTFGHQQGDQAILDAATQLQATFRASDVIGRLGGDEFAIIVPDAPVAEVSDGNADPVADVEAACERLAEAVAIHNATANRPYRLSLSVGSSRFDPDEPASMEVLLDSADREMYVQKRVRSSGVT